MNKKVQANHRKPLRVFKSRRNRQRDIEYRIDSLKNTLLGLLKNQYKYGEDSFFDYVVDKTIQNICMLEKTLEHMKADWKTRLKLPRLGSAYKFSQTFGNGSVAGWVSQQGLSLKIPDHILVESV